MRGRLVTMGFGKRPGESAGVLRTAVQPPVVRLVLLACLWCAPAERAQGGSPNNLNPSHSLCLKLRGVADANAPSTCVSEDAGCGPDPAMRCTDNDFDPLNGGVCIDRSCFDLTGTITVDVELGSTTEPACGAQLFMEWDVATLVFLDHEIDPDVEFGWSLVFANLVDTELGTVDVAYGIPIGQQCNMSTGATDGGTLLRLTFQAVAPCVPLSVGFREHKFPTTVSGANGDIPLTGCNGDPDPSEFDVTIIAPPVWTCPESSAGNADCGQVTREVLFDPVFVADPCEAVTVPPADLCTVTYYQACTEDIDCEGTGPCANGTCTLPSVPSGIDLPALLDGGGDFLPGRTEIRCEFTNACGLTASCAADIEDSGVFIPEECPQILHVDQSVNPDEPDGLTWCTAFPTIEQALAVAADSNGWINEVRVAGGTYRPASPGGDRLATYLIPDGLSLMGGYAGCAGADPDFRDTVFYETVLSGDLNGDDNLESINIDDNSYHVVTFDGTTEAAVVDGFTITAANADDDKSPHDTGGGVYVNGGSATVSRCNIRRNNAVTGAAMGNRFADPFMINCRVSGNTASGAGGAIHNTASSPTIINSTLAMNSAVGPGGAMHSDAESAPVARNSIIWDNGSVPVSGDATINYSVVQGGWPGEGNIDADPLFVNAEFGIFQVSATSPALDAGDNVAVPTDVTVDLIGSPRFINDPFSPESGNPDPSGQPLVDMGAFELLLGDTAQDGDVDLEDYQQFFECSGLSGQGPLSKECVRHDFDGDGDIDLLDMLGFQIAFTDGD